MAHGIHAYHEELRRFERRLSAVMAGLSAGLLLGLWLMVAFQPRLPTALRHRLARWGFEGRTQFVQRITLEQFSGRAVEAALLGPTTVRIETVRGGATLRRRSARGTLPDSPRRFPGAGNADVGMELRSVSRIPNVPLVQSEELVIERLVRPEYPEEAVRRNLEGRVQIQALVDTGGRVIDVQLFASSGETMLERAAETAVWQCRFRPYAEAGVRQPVYALFRFNFRLY